MVRPNRKEEEVLLDIEGLIKPFLEQIDPIWQATAKAAAHAAETFYREVAYGPFNLDQAFALTLAFMGKTSSINEPK